MGGSRGTEPRIEERRIQPREEEDALRTYLAATFDGTVEVILYGLPALLWSVIGAQTIYQQTTVLVATLVMSAAVGAYRYGWLPFGPTWPPTTSRLLWFRVGYYNLLFAALIQIQGYLDGTFPPSFSGITPGGVAAAVVGGIVGTALLPSVAHSIRRLRTASWTE